LNVDDAAGVVVVVVDKTRWRETPSKDDGDGSTRGRTTASECGRRRTW
jgi:hypothetical protein